MKPLGCHNYYVYILTNSSKSVLYTGVTNNLQKRLYEHKENAETKRNHFTGRYKTIFLIYYEHFRNIEDAITREKQIKGWTRKKKIDLISQINPNWNFLNEDI